MNKYIIEKDDVKTEYEFIKGRHLPENLPISASLTFAFIGQNLVIVQKENGWWDIIGGKVEGEETWTESLKREAGEEAGVLIDNIEVVGYVHVKNSGNLENTKFAPENIMPVTTSFVKKVQHDWQKIETLKRDALQKDEVRKLFKERGDNNQLLDIFEYILDEYNSRDYVYDFEFLNKDVDEYPNTQSITFVKTNSDNFIVVREKNKTKFSLPGGGCHMDENPKDCATRETMEESQVSIKNIKLLGVVLVKVLKDNIVMSTSKQSRFFAEVESMNDFIPERDGFEMVERREIPFNELRNTVALLQNDTGDSILDSLKNFI